MRGLFIVSLFTTLAACGAYSPNLPPDPFVCGDSDPKCPDGFACVQSGSQMLCMSTGGGGGGGGDSGTFMCDDDSQLEGTTRNDTIATAFVADVAGHDNMLVFDGAAICPATDVDDYEFTLATTMTIEVRVEYYNGGPLEAAILASSGEVDKAATTLQGSTNTLDAVISGAPAGTYYASVFSSGSSENNYKITMTLTN